MHYDFRVVAYATSSKAQTQFTIRAYLKNGKRWAKFPYLAPQTRMLVVGKVCGSTHKDRYLGVLVDGFTFLNGTDGSTQQAPPQTPMSNKRSRRDLWDRADIEDIDEGPSTPSKVPRTIQQQKSPLNSSQVEVPETPFPPATSPPPPSWTALEQDHSGPETEGGDEEGTVAQGKRPQRARKPPK